MLRRIVAAVAVLPLIVVSYACKTESAVPAVEGGDAGPDSGSASTSNGSDGGTKDSGSTTSDGGGVPSCAALQAQAVACPDFPTQKPSFEAFCASVSPDCRACFDGKMCGESASCEASCQVFTSPACTKLQADFDACPGVSETSKASFATFCQAASPACRACLDGNVCGVTQQCDALCKKR